MPQPTAIRAISAAKIVQYGSRHMESLIVRTEREGQLVIYTQPNAKKKTLYYRIKIPGRIEEYERKSTKTTDIVDALKLARDRHDEMLYRHKHGMTPNVKTFRDVAPIYISDLQERLARREVSLEHFKNTLDVFNIHLIPYFAEKKLDEIKQTDIESYHKSRVETYKSNKAKLEAAKKAGTHIQKYGKKFNNLRPYTAYSEKNNTQAVNTFISWCKKKGYLALDDQKPFVFSKPEKERRGTFTEKQFGEVIHYAREKAKQPTEFEWHSYGRKMLYLYCRLLAFSGMRPGEALDLRFKDCTIVSSEQRQALILDVKDAKTGDRRTLCTSQAIKVVQRIGELHPNPVPDALLFMKNNGKERISGYEAQFKKVLDALGFHTDNFGNRLCLYSFRHFYITRRIIEGIPIKVIAANVGNSAEMIEKNYAHVFPETMIDMFYAKEKHVSTRPSLPLKFNPILPSERDDITDLV